MLRQRGAAASDGIRGARVADCRGDDRGAPETDETVVARAPLARPGASTGIPRESAGIRLCIGTRTLEPHGRLRVNL